MEEMASEYMQRNSEPSTSSYINGPASKESPIKWTRLHINKLISLISEEKFMLIINTGA